MSDEVHLTKRFTTSTDSVQKMSFVCVLWGKNLEVCILEDMSLPAVSHFFEDGKIPFWGATLKQKWSPN